MNNKILCLILACVFGVTTAQAASDKIHVASLEEFSTANPSKTLNVVVAESGCIGQYLLKTGDVIHCNVIKTIAPKRGKRGAGFVVQPVLYTTGETTETFETQYYGKYADKILSPKNIDPIKAGKKAAVIVGGHFVKGLAPAVSLAEGMIENEEGNRLESGVKQVYKDSPLSFVEKGKELNINPGEQFYLIFKPLKNKQKIESVDSEEVLTDETAE